ncbi:MAG: glycosyltransferase family 2 protein [Deltaproteobacteria bacterium]|nr:glycosyltransferase family 2 protein [Deltaproteobacteria bacterium]
MKPIAALLPWTGEPGLERTLDSLRGTPEIGAIALAALPGSPPPAPDATAIAVETLWSAAGVTSILDWFRRTAATHLLWLLPGVAVAPPRSIERLWRATRETDAALGYADFFDQESAGGLQPHPLIDYQPGGLRDDFDFGPALLVARPQLEQLTADATAVPPDLRHGALYHVRLRLAEIGTVLHLPEPLLLRPVSDRRGSGARVFDYLDPRQRDYQLEMEQVATAHLRRIDAWLPPGRQPLAADASAPPVRASVVIPVRDRVKTVGDAVRSALAQRAGFEFNVIAVDNHSTDGTSALLAELAQRERRLVHLVPERRDLGIGGCWNEAIFSPQCGRYAVQLDSDDLYDGDGALARLVEALEAGGCALLIGAYTTVAFDLSPLSPGLIDHREWSDDNGHNNALRVHGLGAPRCYHVPTLRSVGGFPNASYGEDYAAVLRLCRSFRVGRVYDSLYWCRRWEGNSDSALSQETQNRYHAYKDRLRTIEIAARQQRAGVAT